MTTPAKPQVTFTVDDCPVCHSRHLDLVMREFTYDVVGGMTHWALCPEKGEPLLAGQPQSVVEYGIYSTTSRQWLASGGALFHTPSLDCALVQLDAMVSGKIIRGWVIRRFGSPEPVKTPDPMIERPS